MRRPMRRVLLPLKVHSATEGVGANRRGLEIDAHAAAIG